MFIKPKLISNLFLPSFYFFIFLFFALLPDNIKATATISDREPNSKVYHNLKEISSTAQQVKVGFYTQNIYELDPESNTYYMDFYVWFKWKGEIDPTEKLEFMNGVEDWGVTMANAYEEPKQLSDSSYYQLIRVEGRFRENFEFEQYPLDKQKLGVVIENSVHAIDELVYLADTSSGFADDLSIPGWEFEKYDMSNLYHTYYTNFGDTDTKTSTYSALRFELVVSRPVNYFFWKLLLPLIIVLISSWGALLLDPIRVDSRIFLPITALLTAVFLQQSYSVGLPAVSYLVLIDKIYVLGYMLIIADIMETIYTAGILQDGNHEAVNRIKKIDRAFMIVKLCFVIIGFIFLMIL